MIDIVHGCESLFRTASRYWSRPVDLAVRAHVHQLGEWFRTLAVGPNADAATSGHRPIDARVTISNERDQHQTAWQDWKRHYARLRNNQMVNLWSGGRPVALTMCGLLGQAGTDVRHAEDCDGCKRSLAEEKGATAGPSRR